MFKKRWCFVLVGMLILIFGNFTVSAVGHNANNILSRISGSNMTLQSLVSHNVALNLIGQTGYDQVTIGGNVITTNCLKGNLDCEIHGTRGWYKQDGFTLLRAEDCSSCGTPNKEDDTDCIGGSDWYNCVSNDEENKILEDDCTQVGIDNSPVCKSGIRGWYNDNNELISQDNNCNIGTVIIPDVWIVGNDHISCSLGTSYNSEIPAYIGHNSSQIWVAVGNQQDTLYNFLNSPNYPNRLCPSGTASVLSASGNILRGKYHYANETTITLRTLTTTLQTAINKREFCKGAWVPNAWGACSTSCGYGTQTRTASCKDPVTGLAADESRCDITAKPALSQSCSSDASCHWSITSHSCTNNDVTKRTHCDNLDGYGCAGNGYGAGRDCYKYWCGSQLYYSGHVTCQ